MKNNIKIILLLIIIPHILWAQTAFVAPEGAQRGNEITHNTAPIIAVIDNKLVDNKAINIKSPIPPNLNPVPAPILPLKSITEYGKLTRASGNNQIQASWDDAKGTDGIFQYEWCAFCTYKIATREFFITNIELPKDEIIETIDLGDNSAFQIKQRAPYSFAIKPLIPNVDTNIIIYTAKKNIYAFYVRAEGISSPNIPDMLVRINAPLTLITVNINAKTDKKIDKLPVKANSQDLALIANSHKKFPQEIKFDPSKIHGWQDYELKGDKSLKPVSVFRDEIFTYINFGNRWNEIDLPVAFIVNDGVDENINTRVVGTTLIIESVAKTITLISGKKFLCLIYGGA